MEIISNFIRSGIINLIKDGNRIASTTSFTTKLLEYKNKVASAAEIGDNYPFQLLAAFLTWSDSTSSQHNAFHKQGFFLKSKVPIIILQTPEGMEINQSVKTLDFTIASSDNI